jgi:hypothetical protein
LIQCDIIEGCGIGATICIMDDCDPKLYAVGEEHEWYVTSKKILENVGAPELVKAFDKKFPTKSQDKAV